MLLYCGHHLGLKEGLSATENLVFGSTLADAPVNSDDVYDALHQVGLQGKEQQPLRTLSQGQRRRVNLARLLLQKRALWERAHVCTPVTNAHLVCRLLLEHTKQKIT